MSNFLLPYLQYILPQHLLTALAGKLADARTPWLKRWIIQRFINTYHIDLTEAAIDNPDAYECFNQFFIRQLKPGTRPIVAGSDTIASPADGYIAQIGDIHNQQLIQAKNFYFDLDTLLAGESSLSENFYNGTFATIYLAPHNYHRVHMPLDGRLIKTIYVPGKLFSVNRITSQTIPHLYSRNERLICIFETPAGLMSVILVGAMIVGSIQAVWMQQPIRAKHILTNTFANNPTLQKGAELGYFKLGSTVIVLFSKDRTQWHPSLTHDSTIQVGQQLGSIRPSVSALRSNI